MSEAFSKPAPSDESLPALLRARLAVAEKLAAAGVTVVDPLTTYIDDGVRIGRGTIIEPNTTLLGRTSVGQDCRIGPNSVIDASDVGDRCVVFASVIRDSSLGPDSDLGPFGHIRGGSQVGPQVHLGHSVEVNRARIGRGTKAAHFCYIADADVGENVNIGAGTVTCNYDGESKHRTVIGDGVFIGSDTMLVAPVTLAKGARTAAGSVVTKDVSAGVTVAGVPAREMRAE